MKYQSKRVGRGRDGPYAARPTRADLAKELSQLAAALLESGVVLPSESSERLLTFATTLLDWNDRLNLLSRADVQNVIRKHVSASLGVLLMREPAAAERWIDVGTGAGFPGLVLKIARPQMELSLLESARKRCVFLERAARDLGLAPVPIFQLRAETLVARQQDHPRFDVVTARAVASLEDCLQLFGPLVATRGSFITFKGPGWDADVARLRDGGVFATTGFELEAARQIPWTQGTLLHLRRIAGPSA